MVLLDVSGALRVLTHPRVFIPPPPPDTARAYISALRCTPNALVVALATTWMSIRREPVSGSLGRCG